MNFDTNPEESKLLEYIRNAYNAGMESGEYVPFKLPEFGTQNPFMTALFESSAQLKEKGIVPTKFFITADTFEAMMVCPGIQNIFDPETKFDNLHGGRLGMLLGMEVYTDTYDKERRIAQSVMM